MQDDPDVPYAGSVEHLLQKMNRHAMHHDGWQHAGGRQVAAEDQVRNKVDQCICAPAADD